MEVKYFVYILTNKRNGTLYTGVTNNLIRRTWEHTSDNRSGFVNKYGLDQLVYFEEHSEIKIAIQREKQIKRWKREWKLKLIEKQNPHWRDLYDEVIECYL